jgi:hypothetical protein
MCYADLQRQKIELSMEIKERLDVEKKKYSTNHEQELHDIVSERKLTVYIANSFAACSLKQEEVIREDGSMKDYVDKYCEVLQSQFKEYMRLTQLETQITANGFSSLTEVSFSK